MVRTRVTVAKATGLPKEAGGAIVDLAFQRPTACASRRPPTARRTRSAATGSSFGRTCPAKKFALVERAADVPVFQAFPDQLDRTTLAPLALPLTREQLALVPLLVHATLAPGGPREVAGAACDVLALAPFPLTAAMLGERAGGVRARLWVRRDDGMPARLAISNGKGLDVQLDLAKVEIVDRPTADTWRPASNAGDRVERVALAHLVRFLDVGPSLLSQQIPSLAGPAVGAREVVARSGRGRLERIDGTRVLFLKGTPAEMGRQHGELLKAEIRDVMDKILYGIGVGSSIGTGRWFFGEIEGAQARLEPFIDQKVLREMDALADAVGVHRQEARLANFFPELFHCSGFALLPGASKDGHVYHGRVLDYLKGAGLEQNAVLIVHQPEHGHAWVNASYAGFVGTVTAMNEKGIAVGEMGGGGYGAWDGKPMAQLLREVMEQADTLEEAVAIMRKGPRTCEYYYIVSDGRQKTAVGIAATPTTFETIAPGQTHPRLKHAVDDAVLLSAGERYEALVGRVKDKFGTFTAESARELMTRPVCMPSNIQSVLFVPDTLDFHVANADAKNVASHTRYTKYNLRELIDGKPATAAARE